MVKRNLLVELASRVLEVDTDASDSEVDSAFRRRSSEWHPDVSDDDDAQEKFLAARVARDVLLGDIDFTDSQDIRNAKDSLSAIFEEDVISDISREVSGPTEYSSSAETRSDPREYADAASGPRGGGIDRELQKEVALGVETVIIYEAVSNMYDFGYQQGDFFKDVNDYVGQADKDRIDFGDYYEATKGSLRDEVSRELFISSCEKIQDSLQDEYGQGTNIREVARIVAYYMVQGGINIGNFSNFVGRSDMGGDDRFTRGHPLGRHGRGSRGDSRFTRDSGRYERR